MPLRYGTFGRVGLRSGRSMGRLSRAVLLVSQMPPSTNSLHIEHFFSFWTDIAFADPYTMWAQHSSGTFSQLDVRQSHRPIDAIPQTSLAWEATGGLAFVTAKKGRWEIPFDDMYVVF